MDCPAKPNQRLMSPRTEAESVELLTEDQCNLDTSSVYNLNQSIVVPQGVTVRTQGIELTKRILVIDDEPFNIQTIMILLKSAFEQLKFPAEVIKFVDKAQDGKQALEKVIKLRDTKK